MRLVPVWTGFCLCLGGVHLLPCPPRDGKKDGPRKTEVSVRREQFLINGTPTYKGRTWHGKKQDEPLPDGTTCQRCI